VEDRSGEWDVPSLSGPAEHDVFYVASSPYRERLTDPELEPLTGGYLDGVAGELMSKGLAKSTPPIGTLLTLFMTLLTPVYPSGPDFDAALRFLEALKTDLGYRD